MDPSTEKKRMHTSSYETIQNGLYYHDYRIYNFALKQWETTIVVNEDGSAPIHLVPGMWRRVPVQALPGRYLIKTVMPDKGPIEILIRQFLQVLPRDAYGDKWVLETRDIYSKTGGTGEEAIEEVDDHLRASVSAALKRVWMYAVWARPAPMTVPPQEWIEAHRPDSRVSAPALIEYMALAIEVFPDRVFLENIETLGEMYRTRFIIQADTPAKVSSRGSQVDQFRVSVRLLREWNLDKGALVS